MSQPSGTHMTQIGTGQDLTPSDAAMTRKHMAAWFRLRGVHDLEELDRCLNEHAGKTEAEMDAIYDEIHGW